MKDILPLLKKGDRKAFSSLYKDSFWYCASYILKNSGDVEAAKDIFNRALEVFWLKITDSSFQLSCTPKVFLYSVCRRLWLKELDKMNKRKEIQESSFAEDIFPFLSDESLAFPLEEERESLLEVAMKSLQTFENRNCLKLLELYYFEKKSHKEIASTMDLTANTSKVKKGQCLKHLKKHLLEQLALQR